MPLDITLLMSSSPEGPSCMTPTLHDFHWSPQNNGNGAHEIVDSIGPFECRRVASFPLVNKHMPKPSNLKIRSYSESAGLNWSKNCQLTVEDIKRELSNFVLAASANAAKISADSELKAIAETNDCDRETSAENVPDGEANMKKLPARRSPRKRVAFADDRGHQLATIRIMTESSDVPPKATDGLLRALSQLSCATENDQQAHVG